jgi:tRNA G18 (ribose-2'-O)-methylase SpoU
MFEHVRHRPPAALERPRQVVVVCAPMRSNVNLSAIIRTAGCCAVPTVIACGNPRIDRTIARDAVDEVDVVIRRSLVPVLGTLRADGYHVVGVEQTTNSTSLHEFGFRQRTALVIGNERLGLSDADLAAVDACVEIPVWGMPHSYNVATAAAMVLYEYCRQFPTG